MTFIKQFFRRRRIRKGRRNSKTSRLKRVLFWSTQIALIAILVDVFYIITIWPNWQEFGSGRYEKSNFIKAYEERRNATPGLPRLRWKPVRYDWIPKHLRRAVIAAEDARFYTHRGFDLIAFKEAMDTNLELMEFRYGASTISQQTIKNMFFSGSRNPLRKWHELILTIGMELNVSKSRILATYLNIAEFGEGIYGVEAASQYYWGIPVYLLSEHQSAELAATLPSPRKHNPGTRTKRFISRVEKIDGWLQIHRAND